MSFKWVPIALLGMALYATEARAVDADASMFSFNGFGTLGVVHSSDDQADFTSGFFKPNGAGHNRTWSADVDSLIGAQVTANFTPQLSAVLQVISEQNYDNSYTPHIEWANIKYQFTPDFSMRVGRTVLPVFLVSDYRKVAYANPWVRPPTEVYYGLEPVTSSDGVDTSYVFHTGEFKHTLQGSYGYKESKFPAAIGGTSGKFNPALSISNTTEYDALTLHAAYLEGNLSIRSLNRLFDAFRQFGPQGVAIAGKYDSDNAPLSFISVGASYDPGDWFVMSEGGTINPHSVFGKRTGWYASGGYRFGKFTPYVAYGQVKTNKLSDPGLTVSALPPFLAGPASALNAALNSAMSANPVQKTISIGGRWDFMKDTALKLQFDHTRIGAGSTGTVINTQPGYQLGGKLNLFSATIDFVF